MSKVLWLLERRLLGFLIDLGLWLSSSSVLQHCTCCWSLGWMNLSLNYPLCCNLTPASSCVIPRPQKAFPCACHESSVKGDEDFSSFSCCYCSTLFFFIGSNVTIDYTRKSSMSVMWPGKDFTGVIFFIFYPDVTETVKKKRSLTALCYISVAKLNIHRIQAQPSQKIKKE